MKRLPDRIEHALRNYLSEEDQVLNKDQACLDFAAIVEAAKQWEQYLISKCRQQPQPIRILALLFAEMIYEHTGEIIHRGRKGGPHARMLLTLANAAELVDFRTGRPYTERQAQEALRTTRDDLNTKAGVKSVAGDWLKDDARAKLQRRVSSDMRTRRAIPSATTLPMAGLSSAVTSRARKRQPATEVFKGALAELLKESS